MGTTVRRRKPGPGGEVGVVGRRAVAAARRILRGFEPNSVRALVHAACSSPTARHRLTGCVAMLVSLWRDPPVGQRVAHADDLPVLLAALYEAEPRLGLLEDWMPLDPRLPVLFRGVQDERSWRFPLHPGPIALPGEVPKQALRYAAALDPVLVERLGFGVADLVEIAARMLTAEHDALAPLWTDAPVRMDSPASVSPAEVDAAAEYLSQWSLENLIAHPVRNEAFTEAPPFGAAPDGTRLARAATAVTAPGTQLRLAPSWPSTMLGPVLVVQRGDERFPVPASLVLQGLGFMITMLTIAVALPSRQKPRRSGNSGSKRRPTRGGRRLFDDEQRLAAQQRWRRDARSELYEACTGAAANVLFPVNVADGGELLLLATGHRHVLAIELVTGLTPATTGAEVGAARRRLADLDTRTCLRLPTGADSADTAWLGPSNPPTISPAGGSLTWSAGLADALPFPPSALSGEPFTLADGTVLTRLVVVDGPWQPQLLWEGGVPVCTLTEFRELISDDGTSTDREELWAFLDEISNLGAGPDGPGHGVEALQMFSILDGWHLWQDNHMLCPAWLPEHALMPVPPRDHEHAWYQRAALDAVDEMLFALDLPGVSDWPTIGPPPPSTEDRPEIVTLARRHPRQLLFVCPDQQVIFGELVPVERTPSGRRTTISLFDAVQAGLRQLASTQREAWQAWRTAHDDGPIVVRLIPSPGADDDGPAVRLAVVAPKQTVVVYNPAGLQITAWSEVQRLVGQALTHAVLTRLAPPTDDDLDLHSPQGDHGVAGPGPLRDPPGDAVPPLRRVTLSPTQEAQQLAAVFSRGWAGLPELVFQRPVPTPFADGVLDQPRTLSPAGVDRAARSVARRLAGRLAAGEHPVRLVRDIVCPTALNLLREEAAAFDSRAALAAASAELERALADRFLHSQDLRVRLAGPWAHETLAEADVMPDGDAARRARAAELLVECLVHDAPAGDLAPDRRDIHRLLQLAAWPLDLALKAQQAFAGIQPSTIAITEHGDIDLVPTRPPGVNLLAWRQAQWEDSLHSQAEREYLDPAADVLAESAADPTTSGAEGSGLGDPDTEAGFVSMRAGLTTPTAEAGTPQGQQAAGLLAVDDAMRASWGFGLDAVRAVLTTVAGWPTPDEPLPPIASVRRADLVTNVATWCDLPPAEINAAVDACTLSTDQLRAAGLRYWQLEKRPVRLALQPLLTPPAPATADELWLLPRRAHATLRILVRYLVDGRLPWPNPPGPLQTTVRRLRRSLEDGLEGRVRRVAEQAGLPCRAALLPAKAARQQVHLAGEVDLLAADVDRRRLWLIEAKHLQEPFSPPEIARHVASYHGHGPLALDADTLQPHQLGGRARPYVDQLLANTAAVRDDIPGALRLLNIPSQAEATYHPAPDGVSEWDVIPLVVTMHVEVAVFVHHPRVAMVSVHHLAQLLHAPRPSPGWWAPWTSTHQPAPTGTDRGRAAMT